MPGKSPTRSTVTVDVHPRPAQPDNPHVRQPDALPHLDLGTPLPRGSRPPAESTGTSTQTDLDAITAVMVTTSQMTDAAGLNAAPAIRPLADYRISLAVQLPPADAEGFITFKGRRYVEVADIGIVPVAKDASTGQHRARLAGELQPSGPALLRDPASGIWLPLDDSPITFALSETRLQAFGTQLDFTDVEPGIDAIHRLDGKLYVVIDHRAYQVLHDLDASTALTPVMRIVRAEDAVAGDPDNRFVATRPGRSEAIVFDALDGWVGVTVPGAGGMLRAGETPPKSLADRFSAALNSLKNPVSRARKLYPSFTEEQVNSLLKTLGEDVATGLARRETDYRNLKKALAVWSRDNTRTSGQDGNEWVELAVIEIKRCWRQETGSTLKLAPVVDKLTLPPLQADFSHIRALELNSVTWTDAADTFLSSFSGLERLTLTRSTVEKLPDAVANLHNLSTLDLNSNRLHLDEQAGAGLSALKRLEHIDLSGNPLGQTPDFGAMDNLKTLNLNNTRIEQWPTGLEQLSGLEFVDLRQNQLSEVPDAILNPPADQLQARARVNGVIHLEDNRFAPDYWKSLEAFWQRVTEEHPALVASARPGAFRLDGDIPEVAMVRRMYPDKNAQVAKAYLMEMDDATQRALPARVQEFERMETQLEEYISGASTADAPTQLWVRDVASTIKDCWRRDSGTSLSLPPGRGPLPALEADFSHVKSLNLKTIVWSDAGDRFLACFSNLKQLFISQCDLEKLPVGVGEMHKLTHLAITKSNLKLDEQTAAKISGLTRLSQINLSDNPLHTIPDFSAMPRLKLLNLRNTELSQWPRIAPEHTTLKRLDLRDNALTEVPQAFINPEADQLAAVARINNVTLLEGNAFAVEYWRTFDAYWQRLNERHPELMESAMFEAFDSDNSRVQRYRRIYPGKTMNECRAFIWGQEEDAVAIRLNSLETEFHTLKTQLSDWAFSGGGALQRYVRAGELASNASARTDRNSAVDRIISCWRRETPQVAAADGTLFGLELDLSQLNLPSLPELDADFSHVGSLKLNNMRLSVSPEGFLTRFRHLRWLSMAGNQLRELPPAVGEMNGLTRLYLQRNRIRLTQESAAALAGRTTLRALVLSDNPELGIAPDFSQIPDIRVVELANTGIDTFPAGLGDQPLLAAIDLSGSRISAYPEALINPPAERLARSLRILNMTLLNHRASAVINAQRMAFAIRLRDEGLTAPLNSLVADWPTTPPSPPLPTHVRRDRFHMPLRPGRGAREENGGRVERWLRGLTSVETSTRTAQWETLQAQEGSDGLFNTLDLLQVNQAGHADLQRRVWAMIDSITEHTPESERLRREVFDRAGRTACCDRAAFTFSNLEIQTLVHKARIHATDQTQGKQLSTLARGLFRLSEVDKIAAADIAQSEAMLDDVTTSTDEQRVHRHRLNEEIEIRLAYRFGLKDRLQLPAQPDEVLFTGIVNVTEGMLDAAYRKVVALDNSPEEFQALVAREFWQEYVTNKYRSHFEAQRQPFQDRLATLDESFATGELSSAVYEAQARELQVSLAKDEATLIETFTRQELSESVQTEAPLAATPSPEDAAAAAD